MKSSAPVWFFVGEILMFLFCLAIVPGLDLLVWHLLHPTEFWQKVATVAMLLVTAWGRVVFDLFVFGLGTKIWAKATNI